MVMKGIAPGKSPLTALCSKLETEMDFQNLHFQPRIKVGPTKKYLIMLQTHVIICPNLTCLTVMSVAHRMKTRDPRT